jgi:DNA-binding sugar fermentation-stimulating protein
MSIAFITEIHTESQNQLHSIPAKRLKEKLIPIASKQNEMARRWFWELLQNASDYNEQVHVRLQIENEQITFSHTGAPFSTIDVLNVIAPDSGKDGDELGNKQNIGKFGSGLISTHVLSSLINVRGIVRSKENGVHHGFEVDLDRSQPNNKEFLMESIKEAKEQFEKSIAVVDYQEGTFQTHFSYLFSRPFEAIDGKAAAVKGIQHVIDILPYTLCFLPGVLSVEIINQTDDFEQFSNFKIAFKSKERDQFIFEKTLDGAKEQLTMLCLSKDDASTAVQINNNQVVPYPAEIAKLFCGLPLTGTELVGLPIIVNSLEFDPSIERDAIELSPNDTRNQKILLESAELYNSLLNHLAKEEIGGLYNISRIRTKYQGIEASKIWFKNTLIKKFTDNLLKAKVIENVNGECISLETVKLPSVNSDYADEFYTVCSLFAFNRVPNNESYKYWLEAIEFSLFPTVKYSFETFLSEVVQTKELKSFILFEGSNVTAWFQQIISLITDIDANLLNKYDVFPNKKQQLKSKEKIYYQRNFTEDLMAINNEVNSESIEESLLHDAFDMLESYLGEKKYWDLGFLCKRIDDGLKRLYKENDGNPTPFIIPLRKLFSWYNASNLPAKDLKELFVWFSSKRATLFLETFNEQERDLALNIAQSGKMQALARLANSNITLAQLSTLADKSHLINKILLALQDEVDDQSHANEDTGNLGEELVYKDLQKKFPTYQGYEVIWSSKTMNEPRFDYEIKKGSESVWFVDAKTTVRGISNADSIPFFMRKSQWDFLQTEKADGRYIIARVFLGDQHTGIKYLEINHKKIT